MEMWGQAFSILERNIARYDKWSACQLKFDKVFDFKEEQTTYMKLLSLVVSMFVPVWP